MSENDKRKEIPQLSFRMVWTIIITFLIFVSVVLGATRHMFSYIALVLSFIAIVTFSRVGSLCLLTFILPFAAIFKSAPSTASFFTYLILFYVAYNLVKCKKISYKFVVSFIAFVTYLLLQVFISVEVMRGVKMLSYLLLIYFALTTERSDKDDKNIFMSYILGLVSSSVISFLDLIPNLSDYIVTKRVGDIGTERAIRFTGMDSDPNHYAINVIIALCLIVILNHKRQLNSVVACLLAFPLVAFAIMTYSKSAFLMLFLPLFILLYSKIKSRKHLAFIVLFIGIVVLVLSILAGKIEFLDIIMSRFTVADDASSLTTGRSDIWISYFEFFRDNLFDLLVGGGLNAKLVHGTAAHNTYIDMLVYLGLIGTLLLLSLIKILMRARPTNNRKNLLNRSVWICVIIMYFFLSELFYFDCPFHLMLAMLVSNTNCRLYDDLTVGGDIGLCSSEDKRS